MHLGPWLPSETYSRLHLPVQLCHPGVSLDLNTTSLVYSDLLLCPKMPFIDPSVYDYCEALIACKQELACFENLSVEY